MWTIIVTINTYDHQNDDVNDNKHDYDYDDNDNGHADSDNQRSVCDHGEVSQKPYAAHCVLGGRSLAWVLHMWGRPFPPNIVYIYNNMYNVS